MGGWSGYHHHHHLHHHNQNYSHNYNNHSHHSSIHGAATYGQSSGMSVGAGMSSSLSPGRSSRVDSRMSSVESNMTSSMSSLTSRLNPTHHITLRSPVKCPPPLSDSSSPVSYPQPSISLPEPIKSHQTPHQATAPVGYFSQMYGSSAPNAAYYMPSHLGQLSPPPETSPSSCSSSSIPPSSFTPALHLDPSNPESSGHLGSSSAEFWSEVDRHEFDQYVNVGRNREEAYGRGGGCGGGSKVLNGRSSSSVDSSMNGSIINRDVSSILSGAGGCDEASSPLISALSDASSAVYYSACITG